MVLLISVADPDPGSGGAFMTLDPGSQAQIIDSSMRNFWVKVL